MGPHIPSNEIRRVLDSIRQIVQVLRLSATEAERKVGLSAAQLFVIHKLGGGEAISMNELSRQTHTHQSSVSVVVQRLVDKRLVRRERCAADHRQLEIRLTAAGQRKLKIAPQAAQDRLIQALAKMPRKDLADLARLLEAFTLETGILESSPGMIFEEEKPNHKRGKESVGRKRN